MMYILVALTAVSLYEYKRNDVKKISKKLKRKYEDWLEA